MIELDWPRGSLGARVELNLIGTTAALVTAGVVGAAGSVASGVIGARAAGGAARTQAQAAERAAQLQAQSSREALAFQREQWQEQLRLLDPFLRTGQASLRQLAYLMGINVPEAASRTAAPAPGGPASLTGGRAPMLQTPLGREGRGELLGLEDGAFNLTPDANGVFGLNALEAGATNPTTTAQDLGINPALGEFGSLARPFGETFQAPDPANLESDPGYRFRLGEGMRLLENTAAARGGLLTGATAQDITRYGQGVASDEYDRAYGRALGEFQQRYNIFSNSQADLFNRFSTLAGGGQTTASNLASAAGDYGRSGANIIINAGNAGAQGINNAAAARASGYVGGANAWTNAIGGLAGSASQLSLLMNPEIRRALGLGG